MRYAEGTVRRSSPEGRVRVATSPQGVEAGNLLSGAPCVLFGLRGREGRPHPARIPLRVQLTATEHERRPALRALMLICLCGEKRLIRRYAGRLLVLPEGNVFVLQLEGYSLSPPVVSCREANKPSSNLLEGTRRGTLDDSCKQRRQYRAAFE